MNRLHKQFRSYRFLAGDFAEIPLHRRSRNTTKKDLEPLHLIGTSRCASCGINRELQRKFRRVCCFGSSRRAEVAIYVQVKRLNARWSKQTWWETSHSLYFDFLDLDP